MENLGGCISSEANASVFVENPEEILPYYLTV